MYSAGSHVWIKDESNHEFDIPKGCKILKIEKKKIQIEVDDGSVEWSTLDKIISAMEPSLIASVDDMIHLGDLQEHTILRNLRLRYKKNLIYTNIGDILVAINPYQPLNIYTEKDMIMYSERRTDSPHIFATSDAAFKAMRNTKKNQCILISGESGAGKTESAKLVLQYLTKISAKDNSWIKRQILETNPILEAFGNAKTQRNDNSSRFGKYTNIYFKSNGEIVGGKIDYYLLEKSRVVAQSKNERNYHIFYAILAGLNQQEKRKFHLSDQISDYHYLEQETPRTKDDEEIFTVVRAAMTILKNDDKFFENIVRLFVAILHLGNLKYTETTVAHSDTVEIYNTDCLATISELMGVPVNNTAEFLTKKIFDAHGEKIVSNLTKNQAVEVRDAFAKLIFEKVFDKIILEINQTLSPKVETEVKNNIGILDISGFEDFDTNSFEQLCINYANERLQQLFVQDVFKFEQQIYVAENISWQNINFDDNQNVIDLIGLKPSNIMSLIDEEAKVPQGSDSKMLLKINSIHKDNEILLQPKNKLLRGQFGISHFAGPVYYTVTGFLDRNRDTCTGDIEELVQASSNEFLRVLFAKKDFVKINDVNKKRSVTLSMKFRISLEALLYTVQQCNPSYIRCIKPNGRQEPQVFDRALGCRQLRYLGLTEAARIRQSGYAVRYDYKYFVEEFKILIRKADLEKDAKYNTEKICKDVLSKSDYLFGRTKVFLTHSQNEILMEKKQKKFAALVIEKNLRMWVHRKRFLQLKKAAVIVQKNWRTRRMVRQFKKIRNSVILLQALCRRYLVKNIYEEKIKQKRLLEEKALLNREENNNLISESVELTKESEYIESNFEFLIENGYSNENSSDEINDDYKTQNGFVSASPTVIDFHNYSDANFVEYATLRFSRDPIKRSLLNLVDSSDQTAAVAIFKTILRYMSDLPEPKTYTANGAVKNLNGQSLPQNSKQSIHHNRLLLKKMNKLKKLITTDMKARDYDDWLSANRSEEEKLLFIVGHGILRSQLRNEIFCQIVKQLVDNPSKASYQKGLELLSSCVGCFAPSDDLFPFLKTFLNENCQFSERRLERTIQNGTRKQPPSSFEYQHVKKKEQMRVEIKLINGFLLTTEIDSASTAEEVVKELANRIDLKDTFGFSLFITIEDQVLSLGADKYNLMDAISKCEQYVVEHDRPKLKASWKFHFKKEIFSPWLDPDVDEVAINLSYEQVCKGIAQNAYKFQDTTDLIDIIAKHLIVECQYETVGKNKTSVLENMLSSYPNKSDLKTRILSTYSKIQKVIDSKNFEQLKMPMKQEIVLYARKSWPLLFSKYYLATKVLSAQSATNEITLAVNSAGISFIDFDEKKKTPTLLFPEISEVYLEKYTDSNFHKFKISTVNNKEFIFESEEAESFASFVKYLIDELRSKSKYVIAIKNYVNKDDPKSKFYMEKGDLIELCDDCDGNLVMMSPWSTGQNNGIKGRFPSDYVYVIPTADKPSENLMEILRENLQNTFKSFILSKLHHELIDEIYKRNSHNLKEFSTKHFRKSDNVYENFSVKLWKHTKKPIEAPLLNSIADHTYEFEEAIKMFSLILKYMESSITSHRPIGTELTDEIFGPALQNNLLCDELYCQLMRQLTRNNNHVSEERGWELIWLATGIMSCNPLVRQELELFLTSRNTSLSKDCLRRLKIIESLNKARQYPPYHLEVKTIQKKNFQIFQKIYFPDGSADIHELYSAIQVQDLQNEILKKYALKRPEDFSLYIEILGHCVPFSPQEFFFDFFHFIHDALITWTNKNLEEFLEIPYKLLFKRKIWINCRLNVDPIADKKFHFYQELDRYLKGYRKCEILENAVKIAVWIYKSRHGQEHAELKTIKYKFLATILKKKSALKDYVPEDLLPKMSTVDWRNRIVAYFYQSSNLSKEEAKELFLRQMIGLSNYGSDVFEANQSSKTKSSQNILVGIGDIGVSIIAKKNKDILAQYSFDQITSWEYSEKKFKMTVKNFNKELEIIFETKFGFEMNDLIHTYIESLRSLMNVGPLEDSL